MKVRPPSFLEFQTLGNKLSVGQGTFASVAFDKVQPKDLPPELRQRGQELFGGIETVPPECLRVICQAKGRDVGGTRLAAERGSQLALDAPISGPGHHELVYAFFGAPKLRLARVPLRFARNAMTHYGIKVTDESVDGFTITRRDGRRVRFECFAASRGGDNIRGVPILFAQLTEAAFYQDETGAHNGESIFGGIVPRLLPGGQIVIESTVWAESGLLYREFSTNFGHPTTGLAALCPTRLMRDDAETHASIDLQHKQDRRNALRELEVQFQTGFDSYLEDGVDRSIAKQPIPKFPPKLVRYWIAVDPAFSESGDKFGYAVVSSTVGDYDAVRRERTLPRVTRCHLIGSRKADRSPREMARWLKQEVCDPFRTYRVYTDQHEGRSWAELASDVGLNVRVIRWHGGEPSDANDDDDSPSRSKPDAYSRVRREMLDGQVIIPDDPAFIRELRSVRSTLLPSGTERIEVPRTKAGHGDMVSAFVLAASLALEKRPELPPQWETIQEGIERAENKRRWEEFMVAVSCGAGGRI